MASVRLLCQVQAEFLNYLTVLWGGRRSNADGHCENEESKFDVEVHARGLEREWMKEAEYCASTFQIALLILRSAGTDTAVRFPEIVKQAVAGVLFSLLFQRRCVYTYPLDSNPL